MPLLIAGGDSFTYGNDLEPGPNGYSHQTWSYKLSQQLGYDYSCVAKPGGSNSSITRRIISEIITKSFSYNEIFVAVMWTFTHRDEIKLRKEIIDTPTDQSLELDNYWINFTPWHGYDVDDKLKMQNLTDSDLAKKNFFINQTNIYKKIGIKDAAEKYYNVTGDHIFSLYNTLKEIFVLQCFLESKNIKYIFCSASNDIFDFDKKDEFQNKEISKLGLNGLINYDKWFIEQKGFYSWATKNNYKIIGTHPNEQAHEDWYKLLKDKAFDCFKK